MDGFNEKSNEEVEQQQPLGCLHRFSKTIKIVIIGGLIILLMIPMFMSEDLISERGRTQEEAINEVSEKWSLAQTVTGPYLNIQYPVVTENKGEKKVSIKDLMLFPDELSINGQLKTENYGTGDACVKAVEAGIDMVLMPENLDEAYNAVLEAVKNGKISQERLDDAVSRIIKAKIQRGIIK